MPTEKKDAERSQVMVYLKESWKNYKSDCQYWLRKTSILAWGLSPECQNMQFREGVKYLMQQMKDNFLVAWGAKLIVLPLQGLEMLTKLLEKTNPKNPVLQLFKFVGLGALKTSRFIIMPLSMVVGIPFQFSVAEPLTFVVVSLVVGVGVLARVFWDSVKGLFNSFSSKKQADTTLNDAPVPTVTELGELDREPAVLSQFNEGNTSSEKLSAAAEQQLQCGRAALGLAPT